jgi:HSP20 family protein
MSNKIHSLVPFNEWERDIIDRFLRYKNDFPSFEIPNSWSPKLDVIEKPDHFIVKADVPGIKEPSKTLKVKVERNGTVTIYGSRESEHEEKKENFVRTERSRGSFMRSVTLPVGVNAEKVTAKYKHGVLEITIPKLEKSVEQEIKVEEE